MDSPTAIRLRFLYTRAVVTNCGERITAQKKEMKIRFKAKDVKRRVETRRFWANKAKEKNRLVICRLVFCWLLLLQEWPFLFFYPILHCLLSFKMTKRETFFFACVNLLQETETCLRLKQVILLSTRVDRLLKVLRNQTSHCVSKKIKVDVCQWIRWWIIIIMRKTRGAGWNAKKARGHPEIVDMTLEMAKRRKRRRLLLLPFSFHLECKHRNQRISASWVRWRQSCGTSSPSPLSRVNGDETDSLFCLHFKVTNRAREKDRNKASKGKWRRRWWTRAIQLGHTALLHLSWCSVSNWRKNETQQELK